MPLAAGHRVEGECPLEGEARLGEIAKRPGDEAQVVEVGRQAAGVAAAGADRHGLTIPLGRSRQLAAILVHAGQVAERVAQGAVVADRGREALRLAKPACGAVELACAVPAGADGAGGGGDAGGVVPCARVPEALAPELERGGHALLTDRRAAGAPQAVRGGDVHSVGARGALEVRHSSLEKRVAPRGGVLAGEAAGARQELRARAVATGGGREAQCAGDPVAETVRPRSGRGEIGSCRRRRGLLGDSFAPSLMRNRSRHEERAAEQHPLPHARYSAAGEARRTRPSSVRSVARACGEAKSAQGEEQRSWSAAHRIVCPHSALES